MNTPWTKTEGKKILIIKFLSTLEKKERTKKKKKKCWKMSLFMIAVTGRTGYAPPPPSPLPNLLTSLLNDFERYIQFFFFIPLLCIIWNSKTLRDDFRGRKFFYCNNVTVDSDEDLKIESVIQGFCPVSSTWGGLYGFLIVENLILMTGQCVRPSSGYTSRYWWMRHGYPSTWVQF